MFEDSKGKSGAVDHRIDNSITKRENNKKTNNDEQHQLSKYICQSFIQDVIGT
jgi:hypothetical protein